MAAYDGSIAINTKIDTGGMNKGVKNIGKSFDGVTGAVKKTTQSLAQAFLGGKNFAAIFKNIAKFAAAAFIGGSVISSIRSLASEFDLMSSSVGDKIRPLSDALNTLKGTFINLIVTAFIPLIPYLISAAQWFTKILSTVTQVVAALFGYKTTVGSIMTKTASDAKKTAKEIKGALAAFDQINVLQQQETKPEEVSTGPLVTPEAMTVSQDILDRVKEIKDIIASWFADPIGKLKEAWGTLVEWFMENVVNPIAELWQESWLGKIFIALWENFTTTWRRIWANTVETFKNVKANIIQALNGVIEFITGILTGNWALAWQGLVNIVTGVWGALTAIIKGGFTNWKILFEGWINQFKIVWEAIAPWVNERVINPLRNAFASFIGWLETSVVAPLRNKFAYAVEFIRGAFESLVTWFGNSFSNIGDIARGAFNGLIDIINGLLNRVANAINNMAGIVNQFSWMLGGMQVPTVSAPNIPHLATGAVIPPNAEFLAVLGDQRGGKNIEAPAAEFEKMLQRAVESAQGGEMNIQNVLTLDGEIIYQNQKRVNTRHGKNLLSGGNV